MQNKQIHNQNAGFGESYNEGNDMEEIKLGTFSMFTRNNRSRAANLGYHKVGMKSLRVRVKCGHGTLCLEGTYPVLKQVVIGSQV